MIAFFYLAYQLSFKQTLAAISLNNELANQQPGETLSTAGITQLRRKAAFYANLSKGYNVKKGDQDDRVWQAVSGMAVAKNVLIGFDVTSAVLKGDTNSTKALFNKEYTIKGEYSNLVSFLDTLSKSYGNGRLSTVRISVGKIDHIWLYKKPIELKIELSGRY
ncbi:MAG: hypothetical protein EOO45_00300 [Flavobacterium sp.]|nr:MAG: hypothetical protein EOO45_00300 [Flavobacterium sp.]